jgi:hypothetical protein
MSKVCNIFVPEAAASDGICARMEPGAYGAKEVLGWEKHWAYLLGMSRGKTNKNKKGGGEEDAADCLNWHKLKVNKTVRLFG